MRSSRIRGRGFCYQTNANRGLHDSSYRARTEFNNCFIIYWKYFALRLNACFVCKKTQAKALFLIFSIFLILGSHNSKFGLLTRGYDDFTDISKLIKPLEIFSINNKSHLYTE